MSKVTLKKVLANAVAEVGYSESPAGSNRTKFGAWYPMNGSPWCAMFVSWCFRDGLDSIYGKYARTDTKAKALNAKGRFVKGTAGLKKGDVLFFNWGNPSYQGRFLGISHTGFYLGKLADGRLKTLEGNTGVGNDSNGGQVQIRYRSTKMIAGYFRPAYAPEPVVVPPVPPVTPSTPKPPAVTTKTGIVTAVHGLRVRKGAGTGYAILGTLPYKTKVTIDATSGAWYKINYDKGHGYVSKTYVRLT